MPYYPTLVDAVAEARAILARAEVLDALPPKLRESMLSDPEGAIYQADRDLAVALLARFVPVVELARDLLQLED